MDLITDESKGSEDSKGLNPDDDVVVDDERDGTGRSWRLDKGAPVVVALGLIDVA